MKKNLKLILGVSLLVQAASFVILFLVLYSKKKNLALTLLAMGSVGGAAGAYLVLKEAKLQMQAKEQAALDTFSFDDDDDALFDEEEDDSCCDCSDCSACEKEPQDDVPAKD